jgi:hypothetical protein
MMTGNDFRLSVFVGLRIVDNMAIAGSSFPPKAAECTSPPGLPMYRFACLLLFLIPSIAAANPPVASYIFPAGGQRGSKVNVHVGGLFLHQQCGFEMLGTGVLAPNHLSRTKTTWFDGPLLPLPDSQRQEDYPKDMAGTLAIDANASPGVRYWRVWTSQGATATMKFVVGALPEIVESEIDGDPIPVSVSLPLTINGRIFPREDIDVYAFRAKKGESIRCEVNATRLGSPLDARLEVRDAQGRRVAECDAPTSGDPVLRFVAPADGEYQVRIHDVRTQGGQAFVYRLTVSAEPFVDHVFPLGGRRGSEFDVKLFGQGVPEKLRVIIPKNAPTDFPFTFSVRNKPTNTVVLEVDDHPEFIARDNVEQTTPLPAILNGGIEKPGQIDVWKWHGKKGENWQFALCAARLGSRLDGVVTIMDNAGKALTRAEANPSDPILNFSVPADGVYRVNIQDRFASRGGAEFAYRLRITAPQIAEDFTLTLGSDAITLPRKGTAKLKLTVERNAGFKDPIALEVQGLPNNVTFSPAAIPANGKAIDLTFKADENARIDVSRLTIVGKSKSLERVAKLAVPRGMPEQASVLLAVALPTPFVIKGEYDMGFAPRGGIHKRKYKIERNGYDGPIDVGLTDRQARHLQGVEGPTFTVPAGVNEFTYSAYLPPWMETGRTCRVCIMGVGVLREKDGSEHRVSFSSVNQNEQLVAVVGPGLLALETDRTSYRAEPGKSFTITAKIQRGQGIQGPVELELIVPGHLRGVSANKATIADKANRGELRISCALDMTGAFNMPLIVRATLRHNGEPIVAEAKLDVQP